MTWLRTRLDTYTHRATCRGCGETRTACSETALDRALRGHDCPARRQPR